MTFIYELDLYFPEIYRMCKYKCQGLRKLSFDKHRRIDTTEVMYYAASRVVTNRLRVTVVNHTFFEPRLIRPIGVDLTGILGDA